MCFSFSMCAQTQWRDPETPHTCQKLAAAQQQRRKYVGSGVAIQLRCSIIPAYPPAKQSPFRRCVGRLHFPRSKPTYLLLLTILPPYCFCHASPSKCQPRRAPPTRGRSISTATEASASLVHSTCLSTSISIQESRLHAAPRWWVCSSDILASLSSLTNHLPAARGKRSRSQWPFDLPRSFETHLLLRACAEAYYKLRREPTRVEASNDHRPCTHAS